MNLSWNHIRSYASIALFRGFEVKRDLIFFSKRVFPYAKINKTLTEFDVSWSGLGYDGSVALRRVLVVNKTLKRLNVSNCNIDWTCAKLISQGLAKNSTLKVFNVRSKIFPQTDYSVDVLVIIESFDYSWRSAYCSRIEFKEKCCFST